MPSLRVYSHELRDADGNVIRQKTHRDLHNIQRAEIDFVRGVFTAVHRGSNGVPVTETNELSTLFPEGGAPPFLFPRAEDGALVQSDLDAQQLGAVNETNLESAVGTMIDPTTMPTGAFTRESAASIAPNVRSGDVNMLPPTDISKMPNPSNVTETPDQIAARTSATPAPHPSEVENPQAAPKTSEVNTASAVGTLIDPTTVQTGTAPKTITVTNPQQARQGPAPVPDVAGNSVKEKR